MAVSFNILACNQNAPNQGVGNCEYIPAPWVWAIAIPKGTTITATDAASSTLAALIQTKMHANNPAERWFVLGRFNSLNPESNDPATQNVDDGSIFYPRDTVWNLRGMIMNASKCRQQNILKFNNKQASYDFFFIDANGILVGQKVTNPSTGLLELGGIAMQNIYVMAQTLATWTAVPQSEVRFNILDVKRVQENMAIADLSNTTYLSSLNSGGVQDVYLTKLGASTTTIKIIANANCSNSNLGVDLGTSYAVAGNFVLYNTTTSASVVPSGVSVNAAGEITFTFTAATSGDVITVKQASVSTLKTATGLYLETPADGQLAVTIP